MIEIIEITTLIDTETGQAVSRAVQIVISQNGTAYLWNIGGLPLIGDLQAILDAREAELWAVASAAGRMVDLYGVRPARIVKALALVILDEINILRVRAGLALRSPSQIDDAIKAKLREM